MANLIIGPKTFASTMRALYGYRNLKISRVIDRTLKSNANLVIALDKQMSDTITAAIHTVCVHGAGAGQVGPAFVNPFVDEAVGQINVGLPAIQYTLAEWKMLVETLNEGVKSNISLDDPWGGGSVVVKNVNVDLAPWREHIQPLISTLLARGSRQHA